MKKMLLVGLMLAGFTFADDTTTVSIDTSDFSPTCHCRLIVVPDSIIAVGKGKYIIKKGFELMLYEKGYSPEDRIRKLLELNHGKWKDIKRLLNESMDTIRVIP